MAKKITIASYDIDIEGISKKLAQLKQNIDNPDLGEGVSKSFSKQISKIETELAKLENNLPGAGASEAQIRRYEKSVESVRIKMHSLVDSMSGFKISDKYIEDNIQGLKEYTDKIDIAKKKLEQLQKSASMTDYSPQSKGGGKRGTVKQFEDARAAIQAATEAGNREKIKFEYGKFSKDYKKKMEAVAAEQGTNSEDYKALVADRDAMLAIERKSLALASQIKKADTEKTAAENEKAEALKRSGNAANVAMTQTMIAAREVEDDMTGAAQQVGSWADEVKRADEESKKFAQIESRVKSLFSAGMALQTIRRVVRGAIQDFQELDKQFNEIAIVSDYSTKEMWASFSKVNKVAQEFGVTTKNVLEVQNLYYHQGKDMAEVNKLTAQTLTLAKITGMDYERATSDLTAALNAYNIAAEDAVRVTDTIAAMDTNAAISSEELMTALTKTASIAANAGMSLESTEVFLTKMIETTREAPENLGTALKTIIARFGEVKQEIDGEEIELADVNKVDTALKSIGISLLDTAGQIRDLDDVFMELSSKWDDLDRNTQRYIATQAAGSRQQSRFIAMMEDYDRTLELTEIAQDSAGIGARQLAESMDSMETSINRLKSTWQEFYASLISAGAIKGVIDIANGFLTVLNKLPAPLNLVAAGLVLWGAKVLIVDKGLKALGTAMGQEVAAASGATASTELMIASMSDAEIALKSESKALSENTRQLLLNEQAARQNTETKKDMLNTFKKEGWTKDGHLTERGKDILERKKEAQKRRNETDYKKENKRYNFDFGVKKPAIDTKKTLKQVFDQTKKKQTGYNGTWKNILKKQWGKDGFKNSFTSMKNAFSTKSGIGKLAKGKVMGVLTKAMPILTKIATTLPKIITFITQLINPITVLIAVTTGALVAYRRLMGQTLDDTKNIEKLEKAQEKYNNSLKEYNELQKNAKIYEKYRNRNNLSEEQLQEQQEAAIALVDEYPSLLDKIDEEGKYHLKNAEEIQKEILAKEELLDINSQQYGELRTKYAKKGIYVDQNTKAGQSMKNLQDYAGTLDKDALKELANSVDKLSGGVDLNFNKSRFYDAMGAYASGEKSSFGYKEFSDWFAGDIGEDNWNEFLDYLDKNDVDFNEDPEVLSQILAEALKDTNAYAFDSTAEEAANTFIELNKEMGGVLGTLLEGAAEEYSQIDVSQASIYVAKGNFEEDLSSEIADIIAKTGVDRAIKEAGGEEKWKKKKEKKRSDDIEQYTGDIVLAFEELSKTQIKDINTAFTSENVGAMSIKDAQLNNFNIAEDNIKGQRAALEAFWNSLPLQIKKQFSKEDIEKLTDSVVLVLFNLIKDAIGEENVTETITGLIEDLRNSRALYGNVEGPMLNTFLNAGGGTIDQLKAYQNLTSKLSDEQISPYVDTIIKQFNIKSKDLNIEEEKILKNTLLNTDFFDVSAVTGSMDTLRQLGFTSEEVAQMIVDASNGIEQVVGLDFASVQKSIETTIESFSKGIEGMAALIEGTANFEQVSNYLNEMKTYYTELSRAGDTTALDNFSKLAANIQATGKGFKIGTDAADDYGESLYNIAIDSYKMQIALLKGKLAIAEQNKDIEEMIELQSQISMLQISSAQLDAQWKQSRNDALIDNLSKAKEKADELVNSLKTLVDWLRGYDRYANLDEVISTLEEEYGHLEFEINFSTNAKVIGQDMKKSLDNINSQIFANQGGIQAAKKEQSMWRDTITKRNSQYVSFDKNGNAIVNAKEMEALQRRITAASEERKPVLQAEYDEIMNNVGAYNKAKDKVEDYSKALEDNFRDLENFLKSSFDSIMKVEDKLIKTRMAAEDRELDAVKKKYEAIKEENDKYLDSVRRMVDKEREIRDRANKEEDVKDKEKKLAMMKMDTSGIYASDIRSLEKELEGDYQDLEDDAIDRAISELEEQFNTQAEVLDKEVKYLENALEYKRKKMTEYNQWAQDLMKQGSDEVLAYLKANDEEYYTGTAAAQANWTLEWSNAVAQGEAANSLMATTLIPVMDNLMTCKENANGFKGSVEEYSDTVLDKNPSVASSTEELVDQYADLADGVGDVAFEIGQLAGAYDAAAQAAYRLKAAQDLVAIGVGIDADSVTPTRKVPNNNDNTETRIRRGTKNHPNNESTEFQWFIARDENNKIQTVEFKGTTYTKVYDGWGDEAYIKGSPKMNADETMTSFAGDYSLYWLKFATGGFADFTGPAWLDGTKKKPEAVLNALQTKHFIQFTNVLDTLFGGHLNLMTPTQSIQKGGDANYTFHINVDQMASDYDVDRLIKRIEEKATKASQYRNVTILKKSN